MRVLIADDDPVNRRLLEATLTKWGCEVESVCDGIEAWKSLHREDGPKLAILDWMMPGMDGLEVCSKVRKQARDAYIYIILLTAKGRKQDIIEGINAGADDYMVKPFDIHELKARMNAGTRILELHGELLTMRETLQTQATHDALTGLPNRLLFSDRLTQRLSDAQRHHRSVAVMFIDLDNFKLINDTMGHNAGDVLLKQVSKRLSGSLRDSDTIARMGGDEFTIILGDISGSKEASSMATRVLEDLSRPFILNGAGEIRVTSSIGISMFPSDGVDVESLVKKADTAMYRAKEQGRNKHVFYTEDLDSAAWERLTLENSFGRALERDELIVHYHPRVIVQSGVTSGAEALVRWQHPHLGLLMPDQFIPWAEESGLIVQLGERVLRTACFQNKAWQDAGYRPIEVTVNISARQFHDGDLVGTVRRALEDSGLEPRYLGLELTESALMQDTNIAVEILQQLKALGIGMSIDDFGTGHSSLSYLKRFPTDFVKIDRSFVRDITTDPDDAAIVGAIVAMSHSLNLKVVAEGVETLGQLQFLRSLNCDEMQGYFVSKPLPAEEFTHLLSTSDGTSDDRRLFAA